MKYKITVLTKHALSQLHTGSLMSRRRALLKCEWSFESSDQYQHGNNVLHDHIEFKNTTQWQQAYDELKVELSSRENIPNKVERKYLRQKKTKP